MIVTHKDRGGKTWRFAVDVTPYQAGLFRRALYAFRNVVKAEGLTLAYLADLEQNDAFLSEVEAVVLSALYARFPAPDPTPARPPATAQPAPPSGSADTDREQERKPYYWENF